MESETDDMPDTAVSARPLPSDEIELQGEEEELAASSAPLLDHLIELRSRLIISAVALVVGFIIAFIFSRDLYNFLVLPFVAEAPNESLYFKPLGFFFTRVRLSLFAGFCLAFPVIAWQIYGFVAPGLYRRERKALLPFVFAMPVLFSVGAAFVYIVMVPFVVRFAVGFEADAGSDAPTNYELLTDVGDYLSLVTTLMLAFGLSFQLPVLLTLIARAGLLGVASLKKYRKVAIVGIFAVAAFLTPPDPFSQIILALTIMALYEVSIFSVTLAERKVKADREAETVNSTS